MATKRVGSVLGTMEMGRNKCVEAVPSQMIKSYIRKIFKVLRFLTIELQPSKLGFTAGDSNQNTRTVQTVRRLGPRIFVENGTNLKIINQ